MYVIAARPHNHNMLMSTDRELYKQRLDVLFKHYPSRAFDGRPWGELSEIILVR
jgi:hypothetical protein